VAERGRVSSRREVRHLDLCIKDSPASPADDPPGAARALARHVAANPDLVLNDDETRAWLARVEFLRRARPDLALPDARARLEDVVASCCEGAYTLDAVLKRNPSAALRNVLDWRQARQLDEMAPARLAAPSGASHAIDYTSDPPVYAVRLQEVFGWRETPRVAVVPLRLQLLAPNFRPTQVTQDLASFWANTYAEVRRELKARYPKHPWPEDPLTAEAVAVGRRRH
jgi:ATP-dependent helicase HrpB